MMKLINELMQREIFYVLEGDCETAIGAHSIVDGNNIVEAFFFIRWSKDLKN